MVSSTPTPVVFLLVVLVLLLSATTWAKSVTAAPSLLVCDTCLTTISALATTWPTASVAMEAVCEAVPSTMHALCHMLLENHGDDCLGWLARHAPHAAAIAADDAAAHAAAFCLDHHLCLSEALAEDGARKPLDDHPQETRAVLLAHGVDRLQTLARDVAAARRALTSRNGIRPHLAHGDNAKAIEAVDAMRAELDRKLAAAASGAASAKEDSPELRLRRARAVMDALGVVHRHLDSADDVHDALADHLADETVLREQAATIEAALETIKDDL